MGKADGAVACKGVDMNEDEFVARYRKSDGLPQSLKEHLEGVAEFAEQFAAKIGLPIFGKLMGWNHDPGKYPMLGVAYE